MASGDGPAPTCACVAPRLKIPLFWTYLGPVRLSNALGRIRHANMDDGGTAEQECGFSGAQCWRLWELTSRPDSATSLAAAQRAATAVGAAAGARQASTSASNARPPRIGSAAGSPSISLVSATTRSASGSVIFSGVTPPELTMPVAAVDTPSPKRRSAFAPNAFSRCSAPSLARWLSAWAYSVSTCCSDETMKMQRASSATARNRNGASAIASGGNV